MKSKRLKGFVSLPIIIWVAVSICACRTEINYPQEYVMADSAYMLGDYQLGDVLLDNIRKKRDFCNSEELQKYYKLLLLEHDYEHNIFSNEMLTTADSLCQYYSIKEDENDKYARVLLFMGTILYKNRDYPTALQLILKAKVLAEKCKDNRSLSLIYRKIGDIYYSQRLFKECEPNYRYFNQLATANKDTLRMAFAACCMGEMCIFNQQIDSVIYYYNRSMDLGKGLQQEGIIVPIAQSNLCDLYIQLEEFDKAAELMPRDSLNDGNWAYWHYGQNHVDSAIYYFQKILGRYKWLGEVDVLKMLAQLEEQRGNLKASLDYHARLAAAQDSLKAQLQREETLRMEARHHYESLQQERQLLEQKTKSLLHLVVLMVIIVIAVALIAVLIWRSNKQREREAQARQKMLENKRQEQQRLSQQQLEENRRQLETLEQQLAEARQQNDTQATERLQMETDVLKSQNQNIEARERRKEALLVELKQTALYQRLKAPANGTKRMTEVEWHQLGKQLDDIYDLKNRLLSLAKLSETELRICYLLKIGVPPTETADILCKSKGANSLARKRMYWKLTAKNDKAEKLDELIADF